MELHIAKDNNRNERRVICQRHGWGWILGQDRTSPPAPRVLFASPRRRSLGAMKTMLLLASLAASAVAQTTNVKCVTTAGSFTAVVERSNSPQGVDRFLELVSS